MIYPIRKKVPSFPLRRIATSGQSKKYIARGGKVSPRLSNGVYLDTLLAANDQFF